MTLEPDARARTMVAYETFCCGVPRPLPLWDGLDDWIADALVVAYVQGKLDGKASQTERIQKLEAALRPFAFRNAPDAFLRTDGGCTEALIEDADVQEARAALEGR